MTIHATTEESEVRLAFDVPIIKAVSQDIPDGKGGVEKDAWLLQGVASTETKDLQSEIVLQKGIDFTEMLARGYINWNHTARQSAGSVLGKPVEARFNTDGNLFVVGKLFKGLREAQNTWELANYLGEHPEENRRLGWSIEGSGVRKGNVVVRTRCRHIALTHDPVQTDSWADIVKAMTVGIDAVTMKSLTSTSASALLLENLDSGQRRDVVNEIFFGPVLDNQIAAQIWKADGTFVDGPISLFRQLVAKGLESEDAEKFVLRLKKAKLLR